MNERRRFLQVVGSGVVAVGTGCSATVQGNPTGSGAGGSGAGGSGAGGSGAGGMGTGGTTTTTNPACTMNPPGTKAGKPTDYTAHGLHIVTNSGFLVGHDAGGFYALSAVCTHQFCDMSAVDAQGPFGQITAAGMDIVCLCHGSQFGPTGGVVQGPAHTALKAYALALGCDGFLYVNKAQTVAATVRLMA